MLRSLLLRKATSDWQKSLGMKTVATSDIVGHFPASVSQAELIDALHDIDSIIISGEIAKNSAGTIASIVRLPTQPIFIKRVNHKSKKLHHLFRYMLVPSRGYVNAIAASRLEKHGIPTPHIYGAAERRHYGLLTHSFIFAEPITNAIEVSEYLVTNSSAPPQLYELLSLLGSFIKKIHLCGLYHGDLKLSNLYFQNNKLGVWDLDGIQLFKTLPSSKYIERDLGRALSSFLISIDKNPTFTQTKINISDVLSIFCTAYDMEGLCASHIFKDLKTYWLRKNELEHFVLE